MAHDIIVPSVGESITEVIVAEWLVEPGEWVAADAPVVSLETDKVNVEVPAPVAGVVVEMLAEPDATLSVGDVLGRMEAREGEAADAGSNGAAAAEPAEAPAASPAAESAPAKAATGPEDKGGQRVMPSAQRVLDQGGVSASGVDGTGPGGRVLKEDAQRAVAAKSSPSSAKASQPASGSNAGAPQSSGERLEERVRMTSLRRRIAERLVEAQQTAAILTTFNEVDMSAVMALRSTHKQAFIDKHGIKLGFMSFFIKASIEALKEFPAVNAMVDGNEIVYRNYYDVGVAIGGGKGLVVPVIRNAEQLSFAEIELTIADLAKRAQANKLTLDELQGGTFSISNGGVYGSMMSTPILNPPQSGILGMHSITDRAVVIDGKVEVRPMMYLALSYDHRIIDGREAVSFLRRVKQCIEAPERMLLEV